MNPVLAFSGRYLLAVAFLLCLGNPAWSAIFNVNSQADATDALPGDGICETAAGNGVCTLRAAIQESNALGGPDTVSLPAGTYAIMLSPASLSGSTGSLLLADDLTIIGVNAATTIVDGGGIDRVFTITGYSKTFNFSNLTIQNGSVPAGVAGGGIGAWNSSEIFLTDVVVQNNHAADGGGIYSQGNLTLVRTVVRNNTATSGPFTMGGGIYQSTGILTIRDSTISNNTAVSAGGLFNMGTTTIDSSTFSGNIATNDSTLINGGDGGGAIVNGSGSSGTLTLTNSTISGNKAYGHYGGLYNANGEMMLENVTITGNVAGFGGSAFGNGGGLGINPANSAVAFLGNTILAGNIAHGGSSPDCMNSDSQRIISVGYNLFGNATGCSFGLGYGGGLYEMIGTSANPVNPLLGPLANNGGPTLTHALLSGSPAIDAGEPIGPGNPTGCTSWPDPLLTDQRGADRVVDGGSGSARCDIGAYEFGAAIIIAAAGPDQTVNFQDVVTLDGSHSSSPAGIVSFAWNQTAGTPVALAGADTAMPGFTAPASPGMLTFELTITDNAGKTHTDSVSVTVLALAASSAGSGDSGGGGGGGCSIQPKADFDPVMLILLALSAILAWRRSRQQKTVG